jgi:ketopantoate reductase
MKKIAIVGAGIVGSPLVKSLQKKVGDDIKVIDMEAKDKFLTTNIEPFIIDNPYYDIAQGMYFGQSKPFICKGKHEYTEQGGQWICQCGRNIND